MAHYTSYMRYGLQLSGNIYTFAIFHNIRKNRYIRENKLRQ